MSNMDDTEAQVQAHKLLGQKTRIPRPPDNGLTRALRSCCIIPQRYILGVMGLLGVCNAYTMRVCLNLAITQMVNRTKSGGSSYVDPDACPSDDLINNVTTVIAEKPYAIFDWDEKTQGLILSGFYYGYAATQVPGGYLAEKFGGKWTLGVGLLSTAVFTFLTPVVIRAGGATWLFILRILQGMGEGPTMPALMIMLARWVPPHERSFQGALVFGGAQIGNIFGSFMSGILLADGRDWAYVFYFFGGFGILWFVLWSLFCFSTPNSHPYISKKELTYLNNNVTTAESAHVKDPVPWKAILRSAPVWALVWAAVGHDWGYYTMVTDLPKYSHDVLKYNIATTGTLTALPYIAMWISSFLFGLVCDVCIKKGWHTIKTGRIIHTTIAATGPAICIILASYAGCDRTAAMVYFVLSMALMGGFYSGMKVNALDLAPNYAGTLTSLVNTTSTFAGIITPYLIGLLTPDSTLAQWRVAFWVCFAVLVGTNVIYCIWADGKQQWWDDVRQFGYPEGWKHGPLTRDTVEQPESVRLSDHKNASS
ncbi:putative inorganic phosphate cotransporter [Helicoverpa armigera]|uniref:putative inorganic phosphate cotransporter n=1 Tax=Helicoverpa armigera TaxID=29058 RepID=UPI000B3AAA2F|nr:putative inorganic phosphate cotransporter [Helicoverpa armigera]XP_047024402.1 putative inorganic phosphate cotransporter [Helicoverpa zea]XP_049699670.1 putative inorganic phosphate cotransporter [Helicoverpa armigera]